MLDTTASQATTFPETPEYFRGVLRVMRTGGLGAMRDLTVTFCINEPGMLPNYQVENTTGLRAYCFGSTHSSFPNPDPEAPAEEFRMETLDTVSYAMDDLQHMLAERLERLPGRKFKPASRDPMQDVHALLYA